MDSADVEAEVFRLAVQKNRTAVKQVGRFGVGCFDRALRSCGPLGHIAGFSNTAASKQFQSSTPTAGTSGRGSIDSATARARLSYSCTKRSALSNTSASSYNSRISRTVASVTGTLAASVSNRATAARPSLPRPKPTAPSAARPARRRRRSIYYDCRAANRPDHLESEMRRPDAGQIRRSASDTVRYGPASRTPVINAASNAGAVFRA